MSVDPMVAANIKEEAIDFCLMLAKHFGDGLDRLTLWSRISDALKSAGDKAGFDLDKFVCEALDFIKADVATTVADQDYCTWLLSAQSRPAEWQGGLMHYLSTKRMTLIVHARQRWEQQKAAKKGVDQ